MADQGVNTPDSAGRVEPGRGLTGTEHREQSSACSNGNKTARSLLVISDNGLYVKPRNAAACGQPR